MGQGSSHASGGAVREKCASLDRKSSGALPGAVHDLTAARIWGIIQQLAACGLVVPGDKGYISEDCIRTPYWGLEQAHLAEGGQPGPCPAPCSG
jgi:hypothetical protein